MKITNCSNCAYETETEEYEAIGRERREKYNFCFICINTYLSRATTNPRQYGEQASLFKSIGWIANYLLEEIRKEKSK